MGTTFIDENVSSSMNAFLIIANIINIIYNVPQVMKTYKTKSTKDFSGWFIFMRIFGNTIWFVYSIEINNIQMIINNIITVLSSVFLGYYKCLEYKNDYLILQENSLTDSLIIDENNINNTRNSKIYNVNDVNDNDVNINVNDVNDNHINLDTTIYKTVYGEENYPYTKYINTRQFDF
jgi:MtN3 and saliva related transmembrane protein